MYNELCQKIENELEEFRDKIKENGVDYALEKAYELIVKEEIVESIENDNNPSKTDMKALLSRECLLDELYSDWLENDGNLRGDIYYSVDNSIENITEEYLKSKKKEKNQER